MSPTHNNKAKNLIHLITTLFICYICASAQVIYAEISDAKPYKKIASAQDYIEQQFQLAKAQNKRVIFALGGNWCHDSQSLAKKLAHQDLAPIIEANYLVSFIDVGYLADGFDFTELADMKTFYATPTVLIFDANGKHLNKDSMHIWAHAYTVPQQKTTDYFSKYIKTADPTIAQEQLSGLRRQKWHELKAFVATQEQRIREAYKVVGPMLEQSELGNEDEQFQGFWKSLASFRMQLPKDIALIKKQILESDNKGIVDIKMPIYKPLPWEG
jgi:thioredoxin-related protein